METVVLRNQTKSGEPLEATFVPGMGMNMHSFKRGDVEVIDQGTRTLFEERFAGLGALIGPHFHHRKTEILPQIKDESLFPHIARVHAKGVADPFSHGIARYAPWKAENTKTTIRGSLTGKDEWNGVPLAALEGQNFKMTFFAEMTPVGLEIELTVVSDSDSLVGLHYYYYLPHKSGKIQSRVQEKMIFNEEKEPIPANWFSSEEKKLALTLDQAFDHTFYPYPNPMEGTILLDALSYKLVTKYKAVSQENSWQLYHPSEASFVCIEPISAQDPRHPNLTASSLRISLEILSPEIEYVI